ncbi:MAG: tetratricopeptide repeat protein [Verrucomicrobia bacterium]|nr:tetratricopeptide repeat protein [Verrucomicrobiota bacterium]
MNTHLPPPDSHFLAAAIGWLELGNLPEAFAELDHLSATVRSHPDVLEVRWLLYAEAKDWAAGFRVAEELVQTDAGRSTGWLHRAYAARRMPGGGLPAARDYLLPAATIFPKEAMIPFNLACYACQMHQLDEARKWLRQALRVGKKETIKSMALSDEDLKPLRDEIRRL